MSARELIKWNPTDSVMDALVKRPGYSATRYQGDQVVFDARTRTLALQGKKAGVNRDQTVLVGDNATMTVNVTDPAPTSTSRKA